MSAVIYCPVCGSETPHDWYLPGIWVCVHGPHDPNLTDPNEPEQPLGGNPR